MRISTGTTIRFTTLLDHAVRNVVTESLAGATVDLPPNVLAVDGYLTAAAPPSEAAGATRKLEANAGDPLRQPLPGGMVGVSAVNASGEPQALAASVSVSLPYADANGDGIVDGTSPPVRTRTLRLYWLDEAKSVWYPLPTSQVDGVQRTVSATAPRAAVFGLFGGADHNLEKAHAFPVPFRPSLHHDTITFTDIGQGSVVRIYNVNGDLVRELRDDDDDGILPWDVREEGGKKVASGVYSYIVESGGQKKRGELVIIR